MRSLRLTTILVALTVTVLFTMGGVASAHNAHQDHQGACARSTTSIHEGVEDLNYNGVLGNFANQIGIMGGNGSYVYQMEHHLALGHVKNAVTTANHLCEGNGVTRYWDQREQSKDEEAVGKLPAKYSIEELCTWGAPGCRPITVVETADFPVSCWNLNTGRIELVFWIRKPKKHTGPVRIQKITVDTAGNQFPMPTGIFNFKVTAKGYPSKSVTLYEDPQAVGNYKIGTKVTIEELTPGGSDQWELVTKKQSYVVKSKKGLTFTFKNKEVSAPKPPETPQSPPPAGKEEPKGPICSITGTSGNYSPQELACICNGIVQGASGVTITVNCECVGVNVKCEKGHEEPKEEPKPKCEPPTKGKYPNCKVPARCEFPEIQELEPEGRRLIKVSIKGEDITYVKFTSQGGGFFENEGIPVAHGEKFEQWYIAPSPEERPESGFVPYTVEVIQDNNPAEFTTICESTITIKEEEPRPR